MIYDGEFQITKRELVFSIAIIAIMLLIGLVIHGNIHDELMLEYQQYNTALQIENDESLFSYGMKTNVGNSFVYGKLVAVDPVSYPEIDGEYSYIKKVKERYTKHYRTVTKTRTNSKGQTETYTVREEYWTWDEIDRWSEQSTRINFVGSEFEYGAIPFPHSIHIKTIKESRKIRYCYYASPSSCEGTLYAVLNNDTINTSNFYHDMTIDETVDYLESGVELIVFWVFWIPFTGFLVWGFYVLDNKWLEDKKNNYRKRY